KNNYKNVKSNILDIEINSFNNFKDYQVFNIDDKEASFGFILYKNKKACLTTYEEILVLINAYL
ncbi:hypothetical protein IJG14_02730, partial [bacterium]|nr:hypothetical protein [bacterium]